MFTYDLWADRPHASSCFPPLNGSQSTGFNDWIDELIFYKESCTYSLLQKAAPSQECEGSTEMLG